MAKLSENSITLMDGNIVLTRRDGTSKWQARFKVDGRWVRVTTKANDLKEAKEAAKDLYMEAHYRKKIGVAARSKRFRDVAKLAIERMEKALEAGKGKKIYNDYIQATNNYLIPFFANRHLDTIDYKLLKEFSTWRIEQMGKEPKGSTLANHNSALNRIFDEGLIHGSRERYSLSVSCSCP